MDGEQLVDSPLQSPSRESPPPLPPQDLALPERVADDADEADLVKSAQEHLVALRASRRLGIGIKSRAARRGDVEIIGQPEPGERGSGKAARQQQHHLLPRHERGPRRTYRGGHQLDDEVDDSWFHLSDAEEANQEAVRLSVGRVPRRVAATVGKRMRKSRFGTDSNSINTTPSSNTSPDPNHQAEEAAADRYKLATSDESATAGGAPLLPHLAKRSRAGVANAMNPWAGSAGGKGGDEDEDDDDGSLVTLELPTRGNNDLSLSGTGSQQTLSRTMSPLSGRALFPSESATSTSPDPSSASGGTPFGQQSQQPSRTLTIDEGSAPRPGGRQGAAMSKRTTGERASRGGADSLRPIGLRIPGSRRFHDHRAAKKGKHSAAEMSAADFDLSVAEALKQAGVITEEEDRLETDVLWEHQRGLVAFGLPKFSGNALFQADPPQWTDGSFKASPFNPHSFPCPRYWVWRDSEFMIDMSGDKDEEGWSYALRFRSRFWRGEPQPIRSFVRRRCWIRTRVYRPEPVLPPRAAHAQALDTMLGMSDAAAHPDLGPCGAIAPPQDTPGARIHDLRTACAALPIAKDDKIVLWCDSSSPASYLPGGAVDPRNPFIPYRRIKLDAAAGMQSASSPGGTRASDLEPVWREAVREINFRRALGVMRARTKLDRQRVELFRVWLGESENSLAAVAKRKRKQVAPLVLMDATEGAHESTEEGGANTIAAATKVAARKERTEVWDPEAAQGAEAAELDDVWDVIENRLDELLRLFDYSSSRQTFLSLLLDIHPVKHAYHRYRGYDLSAKEQRVRLERGLEARMVFYESMNELVQQYGGKGGWIRDAQERSVEGVKEEEEELGA